MIMMVMLLKQECDPENYASPVSISTTPYTGRLHPALRTKPLYGGCCQQIDGQGKDGETASY